MHTTVGAVVRKMGDKFEINERQMIIEVSRNTLG